MIFFFSVQNFLKGNCIRFLFFIASVSKSCDHFILPPDEKKITFSKILRSDSWKKIKSNGQEILKKET